MIGIGSCQKIAEHAPQRLLLLDQERRNRETTAGLCRICGGSPKTTVIGAAMGASRKVRPKEYATVVIRRDRKGIRLPLRIMKEDVP